MDITQPPTVALRCGSSEERMDASPASTEHNSNRTLPEIHSAELPTSITGTPTSRTTQDGARKRKRETDNDADDESSVVKDRLKRGRGTEVVSTVHVSSEVAESSESLTHSSSSSGPSAPNPTGITVIKTPGLKARKSNTAKTHVSPSEDVRLIRRIDNVFIRDNKSLLEAYRSFFFSHVQYRAIAGFGSNIEPNSFKIFGEVFGVVKDEDGDGELRDVDTVWGDRALYLMMFFGGIVSLGEGRLIRWI
ncbi:hypothetical protein SISSUDRAFT_74754 [Sistotremastrum suecicum HHB10207 ss-3]|uniref:Uncharacterized protein n=1 Tax=Sistotremastrum suecicum HHB10207 ss-3 TaxID=1314776 RepID=A0A166BF08_9AGAM|nr:hypothetical protein SISSUDRAFT_74754 [Sistotremastrum suecicum HHB10207 ss-3]